MNNRVRSLFAKYMFPKCRNVDMVVLSLKYFLVKEKNDSELCHKMLYIVIVCRTMATTAVDKMDSSATVNHDHL